MVGIYQAGSEAAVHAMRSVFEDANAEAQMNRNAASLNIQKKCLPLTTVLINTYRHQIHPLLFVEGETLVFRKDTTQGDLWPCMLLKLYH